ncbi:unnamed protein product [Clonostachys chloroleuca]|uniref:Zn(2)-C6 fungal-type domain-containing protein n=1 Tax=Clonostachys chloroleuca TaxID=1926264 RepID=A0AA35M3L7_9HYPO|nr:unnamed protein product [Clonostachys chloroleuca]
MASVPSTASGSDQGHCRSSKAESVDLSPGVRRRSSVSNDNFEDAPPTKTRKVSRACDFCKSRKAKCSGNQPCTKCVARGRTCLYNAKYTRGRPPTPPPAVFVQPATAPTSLLQVAQEDMDISNGRPRLPQGGTSSRASPELDMAEIQGQVFDPTSGHTFLHRARKRLSTCDEQIGTDSFKTLTEDQPVTMAGDRFLPESPASASVVLPSPEKTRMLMAQYFDVCIATYRILHRPSVEGWLSAVERNIEEDRPVSHGLGNARAAIVLAALAIAMSHEAKHKGFFSQEDEVRALSQSDVLFGIASRLTDEETGCPKLESVQARIVQTLYLLITSRFNKCWYVFGNALQLISAIGLHRRGSLKRRRMPRADYIHTQCSIRTFWTAYILDTLLGVIFGRPRHFHDEDIDQEFPDRINDEDMTAAGPTDASQNPEDCHMDALIFHAKISQICGAISRKVYTLEKISKEQRISTAHHHIQLVHEWRASLPLHLGSIRPSMLIPTYRRQATVLKLANAHTIMHASRLFILDSPSSMQQSLVEDCIAAARSVLEIVDSMTKDGPNFQAFWWTHYVTFCALIVVYVWEIQQQKLGKPIITGSDQRVKLLELAERCQSHLARATATNSPSRRYAVILEEFRATARRQPEKADRAQQLKTQDPLPHVVAEATVPKAASVVNLEYANTGYVAGPMPSLDPQLLEEWQTTDWLELDSSAFWTQSDLDEAMGWPGIL